MKLKVPVALVTLTVPVPPAAAVEQAAPDTTHFAWSGMGRDCVLAPVKDTVTGIRSKATLGVMAVTLRTAMTTCSGQAAASKGKGRASGEE